MGMFCCISAWCLMGAMVLSGAAVAQGEGGVEAPPVAMSNAQAVSLSSQAQRKLERFQRQVERARGIQKMRNLDALDQSYVESANRARVIVMLRADAAPPEAERFQTPEAREAWTGAVDALQTRVIRRISSSNMAVEARFKNIPGMTCEVTAAGLQALLDDPNVESVQADTLEYRHLGQGIPLMGATGVRSAYDGAGMTIAVIDDGVDYTHPNLGNGGFPNSKVIGGIDTALTGDADPFPGGGNTHGTSVSGIACGDIPATITNDYVGGMAPGARIAAVKVFGDGAATAFNSDIVEGIDWCVANQYLDPANPILVINMSLGGGRYFSAASAAAADPARLASVNAAVAAGITVVASSGNDGYCDSMGVPAALAPVISVGAVYDAAFGTVGFCVNSASCYPGSGTCSGTGKVASQATGAGVVTAYSNTADFLDVFGASHNAYTPQTGGGYDTNFGGTSAAAPYVAGAVALIQAAALAETGSYLPPETIRSLLTSTGVSTTDTKGGGLSPGITKPLVDVEEAYLSFATGSPIQEIEVSDNSVSFFLPSAGTANAPLTLSNAADAGGLSLEFEIETSVEGEEVEQIGSAPFFLTASNVSFGNIFQVTSDTTLQQIQAALSFTGTTNLTFEVFQMPGLAPLDVKTRIFSATGAITGVGLALYGSGPISVPLEAGNYYAIATSWGAISVRHYLDTNAQPAVSFGTKVLAFLFNTPLPAAFTGDLGTTTYNMYQVLTVGAPSWLDVDVASGTIAPQTAQPITVTANASGFAPGVYEGQINILSNDPDEGSLVLPVGMLIGAQNQIYVNFGFAGAEVGTMSNPYNTLAEGLGAALGGGNISILGGGFSPETLDIAQDVTIEAVGDEATVGEDGALEVLEASGDRADAAVTQSLTATEVSRVEALDTTPGSRPVPGGVTVMSADSTGGGGQAPKKTR
jgi:subtilisin family serine protease